MVGVSNATVTDWCKNRKDPTGQNLQRLCEIFGVDKLVILGVMSPDGSSAGKPRTIEARILASGIDKMPERDRERALNMVRLMFEQYADFFEGGDDNDA